MHFKTLFFFLVPIITFSKLGRNLKRMSETLVMLMTVMLMLTMQMKAFTSKSSSATMLTLPPISGPVVGFLVQNYFPLFLVWPVYFWSLFHSLGQSFILLYWSPSSPCHRMPWLQMQNQFPFSAFSFSDDIKGSSSSNEKNYAEYDMYVWFLAWSLSAVHIWELNSVPRVCYLCV